MQTTITVQQFIERHPEFIPMYTLRRGGGWYAKGQEKGWAAARLM